MQGDLTGLTLSHQKRTCPRFCGQPTLIHGRPVHAQRGRPVVLEAYQVVVGGGGEEVGALAHDPARRAGDKELAVEDGPEVGGQGGGQGRRAGPGGVGDLVVWAVAPVCERKMERGVG